MSAEPPWWRRVGLGFIGGIGEGDAVLVGQVKTTLWDGGGAIDEANVGAAPWRWRTGRLIRRDDEIDNGSSSGAVDEGRRAVAVDDVVGEESPAGRRSGGRRRSMDFRGVWRPRCTNGEGGRRGRVEPSLGTRLSEM